MYNKLFDIAANLCKRSQYVKQFLLHFCLCKVLPTRQRARCFTGSVISYVLVHNLQFSSFGGLEVACWPLVPKFAGSNPAAAVGFLRVNKNPQHVGGAWMFVCCDCCVLSGRSLCDELITRSEESYRLWCVVECDLETS